MTAFSSTNELRNYILSKSRVAMVAAQEKVYRILEEFVQRFYGEFDPVMYERTYQLFRSMVKADIKSTGNGWAAEVYFDKTQMDHSLKSVWTEEQILHTALVGAYPHGGYKPAGGTGIWTSAMPVISKEAMDALKEELIKAGIPVK